MTIGAALGGYVDYWEQHAAADGYDSHPVEQLADIRQQVGELIWVLEVAVAPAGGLVGYSQRARQPRPVD